MCFIHRPEYYTKSGEDASGHDIRGLAEFIIAKHRSGAVGDVKLRFTARFARFENWSDNVIGTGTYESKLGGGNSATSGSNQDLPPAPSGGSQDLPADFDFSAGPGDVQAPY